MVKVGVITLGLIREGEYLRKFLENLERVSGMDTIVFDYESLDPAQIAESSVDTLVLSPGIALVGLDTDERNARDPGIRPLYNFIRESVENGIPLLGINAGHLALNCAYGLPIDNNVPRGYKGEQQIDVTGVDDPIVKGIDDLTMNLTNNFAVLSRESTPPGKVTHLVVHMSHPLISRVESEAPVYGVQFKIQPGTQDVFSNFFNLASKYLDSR